MALPFILTKLLARSGLARLFPSVQRLTHGGEFLHHFSDRVLAAPHRELLDAAEFLEVCGPDAVDLALGSPRFDIVPSASTKLPADRRGFPPAAGLPELRTAVAEKLRDDSGLDVNPAEDVLITHGAAGAFSVALEAMVNPGDGVVLFDPTSPLFQFALRQRRARIRWLPTWMEAGRTRFHLGQLVKAMSWAKLIVINSPANPTGGVIAAEDLEQIAWWADRRDVLIYSDEVFERYCYEGENARIGTLPKAARRTLTAGSISKSHALASARVGWLAGNRSLIGPCALTQALQSPFVPTVCQQIALLALQQCRESFEPIHAEFASRRSYAYERLRAIGLQPAWPAGAFFLWLPVAELGMSGREFAEGLLKSKKVLVWPGEFFGPSGAGHIRISYAAEDGRLREGLARIGEYTHESTRLTKSESLARAA